MPLFGLLGGWVGLMIKLTVKKLTKNDERFGKHLNTFIIYELYSKIIVLMFLMIIYSLAVRELIKYTEETFNSSGIAVTSIIFSSITILLAIPLLVCILCKCCDCCVDDDDDDDDDDNSLHARINKPLDYFITVISFMFLGYFFPYMIIAFIEKPIQSIFTYAAMFLFVFLLNILQIMWLLKVQIFKDNRRIKRIIAFVFTVFFAALALPYLFMVLIVLFTLGNFDDFGDLKNIILPLFSSLIISLMGVGVYYIKKD